MTDLDKLIAAVEAGAIPHDATSGAFKAMGFPAMSRGLAAYNGSLDAALRLHEALLPGHPFDVNSTIGVAVSMSKGKWRETADADEWVDTNPARSWLLAILRALKAQGGDA